MSISSNSRSDVDLLTSIDPHKLNILDKRIRGDGKGGVESTSFSSPPPRSIISPAPPGTSGGSGSGRPRSNSLCVGDNVSNMTTATDADATWVGSDANNNDGESSSSGCDGASSRSSCQTVHHANLMMRNGGGGIVPGEGGGLAINDSGPAIAASESGSTIHQQALSSNLNNKKKSTPSKRPVSAIGDRMTSPPIRTKSSIGANGGHGTKHKTISTTTSTEEGGIATNSNNRAIGVPCSEGAPQLNSAPVAASSAASTSSGSMHATTTATTTMGPETSRSESRDSTLHSYFGSSVLSSSNHATNATSNPPMIRSFHQQQQHLSPPILHSKQPKSGNQRTLHSFLGISDKKLQQQPSEQDEAKNMIANSEGRIGELGMGVAASTNTSRTVTTSSSSISSTSSSSKKMKSSSTHKVSGPTDSTSTQESSEQHQQQESLFREIKRLQAQLSTLQKQLEEANARNNSIKNNQTLISANLQRQLKFVKAELEEVKRESNARQTKSMEVMENFVREESMREAKELRQSLASDGARLGRLLTSRVGSHHGGGMMGGLVRSSQSIETWEDGHAPKMIKLRRSELKAEKERLEKRLEELLRANKNEGHVGPDLGSVSTGLSVQVASDSTLVVGNELSNNSSSGNSAIILSDLDRMEATETVKMHLHEVKKKEVELDSEERALNIEKRAHVRALKLVSNEDSSKFRSRRKLHDRYVLMNLLGKGGFSEVWRAFDLQNVQHVAVKIHQLESSWSDAKKENYTKHVSREYEIHREVRHPRIVSLYDVFEIDTDSFATVLECCKGTDLDTLLKDRGRLPERDARAILLQILIGMRYLSAPSADGRRQGIIHYDLKPGNILFDEQGNAKITDFGLSKIVDAAEEGDSMELTSQGAGTYWYLPPECFLMDQDVRISNKVDVWSIGVIYFQMLFGRRPFGDGQTQDHILRNQTMLHATEVHFPTNPSITEEGKSFIRDCLTYDQTIRPNICQICEHGYVKYIF